MEREASQSYYITKYDEAYHSPGVSHTAISSLLLVANGSLIVYHSHNLRFATSQSKGSSDSGCLDDFGIGNMHVSWKTAVFTIQTHAGSSAATLSSNWKGAPMSIDALYIVTLSALLAWGLACYNTQPLPLLRGQLDVVAMRAFVRSSSIVVAAALPNIMLIAHFDPLQTLDLILVILHRFVDALTSNIARDGLRGSFEWARCFGDLGVRQCG